MQKHFLKYFVFEWKFPLGNLSCPYAYRWRLDFYLLSFRLHYWFGDDDKRAFHDHPWAFITFILFGGYYDVTENGRQLVKWCAYRKRNHKHYVQMIHKNSKCLSFIITFGKPKRYSFYLTDGSHRRWTRDKYFHKLGHPICD